MKHHRALRKILILFWVASATLTNGASASTTKPKYGPVGKPYATTLAASREYFRSPKNSAPDFWSLIGYYVPQYNDAACSAASVTMALNAARALLPKTSEDKLVTQQELVEKTQVHNWKDRLSAGGFGPSRTHGASLDVLRDIAEAAFRANGFPKAQVTAIHVNDDSPKTVARIRELLVENERSAKDFVLANFDQKFYTDDSEVGHFAPIGAYDAKKKRVLVLDPDRQWYEPYWVDEARFFAGLHTVDSGGKDYRGLLRIQLNLE
jgi:hypothetical protein